MQRNIKNFVLKIKISFQMQNLYKWRFLKLYLSIFKLTLMYEKGSVYLTGAIKNTISKKIHKRNMSQSYSETGVNLQHQMTHSLFVL